MKAIHADDMKLLDEMSQVNIKSIDLMEAAGKEMARVIMEDYNPSSAIIILGSGGNAGDGLVVGRYLIENGVKVDLFMLSSLKNDDAKSNYPRFKGQNRQNLPDLDEYGVIIDAILGNGLKTPLKEEYINVIRKINESKAIKVSLDVPSGLNSDNGISMGAFVEADLVITVEHPKTGFFLNDGMNIKNIKVIKCGMLEPTCEMVHVNSIEDFRGIIPDRKRNSNKGSYGRSSIIAGSRSYPGASMISYSALMAFMSGVGYSSLYVPKSLYEIYALRHPEIIVNELSDNNGFISYNEQELDNIIHKSDSIAIGMGMGVEEDLYKTIKYLLLNYEKSLIIDADGLNTISKYGVDILNNHKCDVIITPHPKEFSRLFDIDVSDVLKDPIRITEKYASKYKITIILKGASSVISNGLSTSISINGTTGLAKGGSGDALSGILAGVCAYIKNACTHAYANNNVCMRAYANNINVRDAYANNTNVRDAYAYNYICACLSTYILGRGAEISKINDESITISDIIKEIPNVWMEIKE